MDGWKGAAGGREDGRSEAAVWILLAREDTEGRGVRVRRRGTEMGAGASSAFLTIVTGREAGQ